MRVSPLASPPSMSERCEIDLSPGTRQTPFRTFALADLRGLGVEFDDTFIRSLPYEVAAGIIICLRSRHLYLNKPQIYLQMLLT